MQNIPEIIHKFRAFCCGLVQIDFPISFRVTSLTSRQSFDYLVASVVTQKKDLFMVTSSNGNIHHVTGPWVGWGGVADSPITGEFPPQKPVTRSFYVFFLSAPEQAIEETIETSVI